MKRKTSTDGKWHYHDVPYLVQHVRSGTFYVRKRWGNKIVQRSLDTTLISEAKVRLPDKLREIRDQLGTPVERDLPRLPAGYKAKDEVMALMPKSTNLDPGKATKFSEAAAIFLGAVNSDPALAERSKLVRSATLRNLLTYWTDLGDRRLADLTAEGCREFFSGLAKRFSPSHYNACRWIFRTVIGIMRDRDARLGLELHPDPTEKIRRLGIRAKEIHLPTQDEFNRVLAYLDAHAVKAAFICRLAAYTGARWYEATQLRWGDVDLRQRQVRVFCAKRRRDRNHNIVRYVPMIPDAQEFFRHWTEALRPLPQDAVMPLRRIDGPLKKACEVAGIPPMRFHDLRHYFATRCIEAGVDFSTVSRWLGHLDGGILCARVYGHLRNDHSQRQAARVTMQENHDYRSLPPTVLPTAPRLGALVFQGEPGSQTPGEHH